MRQKADVWKSFRGRGWIVESWDQDWTEALDAHPGMTVADCPTYFEGVFPTHAYALAHALALVGLTPKEGER